MSVYFALLGRTRALRHAVPSDSPMREKNFFNFLIDA